MKVLDFGLATLGSATSGLLAWAERSAPDAATLTLNRGALGTIGYMSPGTGPAGEWWIFTRISSHWASSCTRWPQRRQLIEHPFREPAETPGGQVHWLFSKQRRRVAKGRCL